MLDARRRLLKPGARLIPHALTLLVRPLLLPEAEVRQRTFGISAVERWRALYDIDFTPLLEAAIPGPTHTITEGEVVATWPPVGPPVELTKIDLTAFDKPSVHASADLVVEATGPGERRRPHLPRRVVRGHLPYPRPLDVARLELGDLGVGPLRSDRSLRRIRPAG